MNKNRRGAVVRRRKKFASRSGVALLAVVVALTIFTAMCHTLAGLAVTRRRRLDHEIQQSQIRCLADAALRRAAVHLRNDPAWSGETWKPALSAPPGDGRQASVVVTATIDSATNQIRVHAAAQIQVASNDLRQWVAEVLLPAFTIAPGPEASAP